MPPGNLAARSWKRKRPAVFSSSNPLKLYRPHRLAELFGVDPTTIWRWRQNGVLPEPVEIGGIHGWTEVQVAKLLQADREGGDDAR